MCSSSEPDKFVEAVLLAEFDIDKGSLLRHQYPAPVSDAEQLLAELMLPEGSHNHFQDWTFFMLNRPEAPRPGAESDGKRWPVQVYTYDHAIDPPSWVLKADAGRTPSHWARLGADAVGEAPLLHVELGDAPAMRLGLDAEHLQYSRLQPDFASMYDAEGAAVGLHFRTAAHQDEFKAALDVAAEAAAAASSSMLWCLSHVSNRRDDSVRRGAQVKALAVCSRYRFVHVWKPLLLLAVDRLFSTSTGLNEYSEDAREQCRYLYEALNALPVSALPRVSELQRQVSRLTLAQGTAQTELLHVGQIGWLQSQIPLRVPPLLQPAEVTDTSLSALLRAFRGGLLATFGALLRRKRVMFLGHAQPAEKVCAAVLSVPLMVSPPMGDVLQRCYPCVTRPSLVSRAAARRCIMTGTSFQVHDAQQPRLPLGGRVRRRRDRSIRVASRLIAPHRTAWHGAAWHGWHIIGTGLGVSTRRLGRLDKPYLRVAPRVVGRAVRPGHGQGARLRAGQGRQAGGRRAAAAARGGGGAVRAGARGARGALLRVLAARLLPGAPHSTPVPCLRLRPCRCS